MGLMAFALALPGGCRQTGRSGAVPDFIQVNRVYYFDKPADCERGRVLEVRPDGWIRIRPIIFDGIKQKYFEYKKYEKWCNINLVGAVREELNIETILKEEE
jgi:hypothetical protein